MAELEEVSRARIDALDYEQLGLLLQASKHPIAIARAVDIYCSSKNWDYANTHYRHVIEPILAELDQPQIFRIFRASTVEGADLIGAHSLTKFAQYVYDHEMLPREEVFATMRDNKMQWLIPDVAADRSADDDL